MMRFFCLKIISVGYFFMSVKLFILGRPGSGKSTAYRCIENFLTQHEQYKNWSIFRYNDYAFLYEMFCHEQLSPNSSETRQFEAKENDGFDVLDFKVLDIALINLEKKAREGSSNKKEEIIVIEFARQDYNQALSLFSASFLKNSYFLFVEADVTTCLERIKERLTNPTLQDNFFVSKLIITAYYGKQIIPTVIKVGNDDSIDKRNVKTINSRGSLSDFNRKVEDLIEGILAQEIE